MASRPTADEDLAARVMALEDELSRLRAAMAALAQRMGKGGLDVLIEDLADRPLSEEEMEGAFARLDAALDATQ